MIGLRPRQRAQVQRRKQKSERPILHACNQGKRDFFSSACAVCAKVYWEFYGGFFKRRRPEWLATQPAQAQARRVRPASVNLAREDEEAFQFAKLSRSVTAFHGGSNARLSNPQPGRPSGGLARREQSCSEPDDCSPTGDDLRGDERLAVFPLSGSSLATCLVSRSAQLRRRHVYSGGCKPADLSQSLIRAPASAWRALRRAASRTGPCGSDFGPFAEPSGFVSEAVFKGGSLLDAAAFLHDVISGPNRVGLELPIHNMPKLGLRSEVNIQIRCRESSRLVLSPKWEKPQRGSSPTAAHPGQLEIDQCLNLAGVLTVEHPVPKMDSGQLPESDFLRIAA